MNQQTALKMQDTHFCEQCHEQLHPTRHWQRFCSKLCRERWHVQERRRALAAYRAAVEATA